MFAKSTSIINSFQGLSPSLAMSRVLGLQDVVYGPKELDTVVRALEASNVKRVVDIGCGYGGFSRSIAIRKPDLTQILGIDISEQRVSGALGDSGNPSNLFFKQADITQQAVLESLLPSADAIIFRYTLQHIQDVTLMERVLDVLRTGATIFVIEGVFNFYSEFPDRGLFFEFLNKFKMFYKKHGSDPFVVDRLPIELKKYGYKEIDVQLHYHSNHNPNAADFIELIIGTAWLIHLYDEDLMSRAFVESLENSIKQHCDTTLVTMPSAVIRARK
ncbi:MAG: methyltransferase domain-containing protein [bacterium]